MSVDWAIVAEVVAEQVATKKAVMHLNRNTEKSGKWVVSCCNRDGRERLRRHASDAIAVKVEKIDALVVAIEMRERRIGDVTFSR